jgi:proteasome lid subunit RPN8/RPN11
MEKLKLPRAIYDRLLEAAEQEAPREACGLLAGSGAAVREFYPLTNVEASAARFSMDPQEQFAALKCMRGRSWEIVGIWHSHPATPARMSAEDRKLAFMPGVSYVILSLAPACRGEIRAFRRERGGSFREQEIEFC